MINYIAPLQLRFEAAGNPVRAAKSKLYVRNQFDFIGLDAQTMRSIISGFLKEYGNPAAEKLGELSRILFSMPKREYHQAAIEIVRKNTKRLVVDDIKWIEKIIITNSWWDTVDGIAVWICGEYFKKFPEQIIPVTGRWIHSGNIWLMRSALLFQLKYKSLTNTDLLSEYIKLVSSHKDFFIRKAIGWVLREYSKNNPKWVKAFVENNSLSGLSLREASKYI